MIAYKCVVVATRPLLLSILKERLERLGQREDDWQSFLAPTKVLISTGIKSALKTLQILTDENSLLGKLFFFFFLFRLHIFLLLVHFSAQPEDKLMVVQQHRNLPPV
jgi:hypothetical protein